MLTPRNYLSYSQMVLFEMSPERYASQYLYGEKPRPSKNMEYGSLLADGLEHDEATGDPALDLVMARLPKFALRDIPFEAQLPHKGETITLLAKPDTITTDYKAFKEYKTSVRRWTQRMADESGQLTFYALCVYLKKGFIPQDIELVNVEVGYKNGALTPTGNIYQFKTKRTLVDLIKMSTRARRAWEGIIKLCTEEFL